MPVNQILPRRALLSVSDKSGLTDLAQGLLRHGVSLLASGGTAASLLQAGLPVTEIASLTGLPDLFGGRVKTLHPAIHGPILARGELADEQELDRMGWERIDLVVVNLYPFAERLAAGADPAILIESIDIGGPAMIRAAAKNHARCAVLTDPGQYPAILQELESRGGLSGSTRLRLAMEAFARIAAYDQAIHAWFACGGAAASDLEAEAEAGDASGRRGLRYGENPHQSARLIPDPLEPGPTLASARQLQGKDLSYNNLLDADQALALMLDLHSLKAGPAAVVVKHGNPCGAALGRSLSAALEAAIAGDPVSAFGGVVALSQPLDAATARLLASRFLEVVVAPAVSEEAASLLRAKAGLRVLDLGGMPEPVRRRLRSISGGVLEQEGDDRLSDPDQWRLVTGAAPDAALSLSLRIAEAVAKAAASNAIVLVEGQQTVGIGCGQMSRVDAVRLAIAKRASLSRAAPQRPVLAGDAFFPFADGLDLALEAGVAAVLQPGGSVRDTEVIASAERAGITMVFTGMRHFRH